MRHHIQNAIKLLFVFSFIVFSSEAEGQDSPGKVKLLYENISVEALLDSLMSNNHIDISYDANALPLDSIVSVEANNEDLMDVLQRLFLSRDIMVQEVGEQIVISKKKAVIEKRFVRLAGTVIGDTDNKPVSLVNISIVGEPLGTITNMEGVFEFVIPDNFVGREVQFSSLGFKAGSLIVPSSDSTILIHLEETTIHLPEIEIKYQDANEVIERFLKNRKDNYWNESMVLAVFFRESIKQDDAYVDVSEAVLEILKDGYDQPYSLERVKFIKGRKRYDVDQVKNVRFRLEGGPFYFSRLDIVRYLDFFNTEGHEKVYRYSFKGLDQEYERLVYRIAFRPVDDTGELLYTGELRIDSESAALVSVEFELTKNSLKNSRKYFIKKASGRVKAKPAFARYYIDYRPHSGKWILNKVRGELNVRIIDRSHKINSMFEAVSEMVINDLQSAEGVKFRFSETFKPNYILADEIIEFDADFWENYNIISPGEALEKVFKKTSYPQK